MESYLDELSDFLNKDQVHFVRDLFEWLMQPSLGLLLVIVTFYGNVFVNSRKI